jgi:hypothetical protein
MTPKQKALYFREFAAARRAYERTIGHKLNTIDALELRYGLHQRALGLDKSSTALTNSDLDKVLAEFRALSRPDDLNTQLRQQNQDRTRKLHWIEHSGHSPAYIAKICEAKFSIDITYNSHHSHNSHSAPALDFTLLTNPQLTQLHLTLKNRKPARHVVPASAGPDIINLNREYHENPAMEMAEAETANAPF